MKMTFSELLAFYENHLMEQVMPFWLKYGPDNRYGGIYNALSDDGRIVSTDKYMWSQGRALWTFSAMYNKVERNALWLEHAKRMAAFIQNFGRDTDGSWHFKVERDGRPLDAGKSVYVDAFVCLGLIEYAKAANDSAAEKVAMEIFRRVSPLLDNHSLLPTAPHPIPKGLQAHGPSMIYALVFHELGKLTGEPAVFARSIELADTIMEQHIDHRRNRFYEFVRPGGIPSNTDHGKTYIPGHIIESMWFLDEIYFHHGMNERLPTIADTIRRYMELGWDEQYGGLYLARHWEGGKPQWHGTDAKIWWTAAEALYALLLTSHRTGERWCAEWYWKVHDYAFRVHPCASGDWHQNLDRFGEPIEVVVQNLQVKDPFHLPRALINAIVLLRKLSKQSDGAAGI